MQIHTLERKIYIYTNLSTEMTHKILDYIAQDKSIKKYKWSAKTGPNQ